MNRVVVIILVGLFFNSCQSQEEKIVKKEYLRWVGDIEENSKIDGAFKICNSENEVRQYFNNSQGFEYYDEKPEILKIFKEKFLPSKLENQNGIIRIRFIVNCKGETGRFRILEADENYKEFNFDSNITKQLFNITKNLNGWIVKEINNKEIDYYQNLIFKIKNGNINEILP